VPHPPGRPGENIFEKTLSSSARPADTEDRENHPPTARLAMDDRLPIWRPTRQEVNEIRMELRPLIGRLARRDQEAIAAELWARSRARQRDSVDHAAHGGATALSA
jgi:hypothetical protein